MEIKEVFEPIIKFVKNFQKKDKEVSNISKQAAKDRLKLVLMQDRASVSPDFFEMMKKEIIDVIKKYIEIDEESLEVQLTRGFEAGLEGPALYANIPIKNIKPVASNGDEDDVSQIADAIAEEILDEAAKKMENVTSVKAEIETAFEAEEIIVEPLVKEEEATSNVESIAENVAKEMKKGATTAKVATTKSVKTASKSTKKSASTTKSTTRKSTKKSVAAE